MEENNRNLDDAHEDVDLGAQGEEESTSRASVPPLVREELEEIFTRLDDLKPKNLEPSQRHHRTPPERDLIIRAWSILNEYTSRSGEVALRTGVSATSIERVYLKDSKNPLLTNRETQALTRIKSTIADIEALMRQKNFYSTPKQQNDLVAFLRLMRKAGERKEVSEFCKDHHIDPGKQRRWEMSVIDKTTEELIPWAFPKEENTGSELESRADEDNTVSTKKAIANTLQATNSEESVIAVASAPLETPPSERPAPTASSEVLRILAAQEALLQGNLAVLEKILNTPKGAIVNQEQPKDRNNEAATIELPGGGIITISGDVKNAVVLVFGSSVVKNPHDGTSD